ncbi:MAG TPA: hypothetical protein PLD13_03425, partial [Methanoculleus sp.]|nr:hypothetical protein [Methanoculleus sp.]
MSTLESYLDALHRGVFQVVVPKALVTEPLEPVWKRSAINVPSPGTIASYRKGQYHAHETASEYHVHMDRYADDLLQITLERLDVLALLADDDTRTRTEQGDASVLRRALDEHASHRSVREALLQVVTNLEVLVKHAGK